MNVDEADGFDPEHLEQWWDVSCAYLTGSHDAFFARCSKRHMHCRPTARFDFVGFRLVMEVR